MFNLSSVQALMELVCSLQSFFYGCISDHLPIDLEVIQMNMLYIIMLSGFLILYEPVQAFTPIWRPPLAHFGLLINTAKIGKNIFFHTDHGTGTMIMQNYRLARAFKFLR